MVFITADAAAMKQILVSGEPTPITYPGATSAVQIAEDRERASYHEHEHQTRLRAVSIEGLPPRERRHQPLLDDLGEAIVEGRDAADFLWQLPDDSSTRARLRELIALIRDRSAARGRREMPVICEEMLTALKASPSPQQVDLLHVGFDRLYKLWAAAKSGLL